MIYTYGPLSCSVSKDFIDKMAIVGGRRAKILGIPQEKILLGSSVASLLVLGHDLSIGHANLRLVNDGGGTI